MFKKWCIFWICLLSIVFYITCGLLENNHESCGLVDRKIAIHEFIPLAYGGTVINRGEFPWLVAIYKKQISGINFLCGGSLVTSKIILSAAHCFVGLSFTADKVTAMLGRYNLTNLVEDGCEIHEIRDIIKHPDYKYGLGFSDADLALLEMKEHVGYTKFIKPICIWSEPADVSRIVNKTGVVVGWGSDEDGNRLSIAPKKVNLNIISGEECLRSLPAFSGITSSRTLCAGNRDGSGPCEGDSGGGLMLNRNGVWMLRGVISLALTFQQRCDLQQYTVYCDIAKHMSWLQNYTKRTEPPVINTTKRTEPQVIGSIKDICGRTGTESRIELPWLAAIYSKLLTGVKYQWAGAIVSQRSVLAPAIYFVLSNLTILPKHLIRIHLGQHFNFQNVKETEVMTRDVANLIFHPDFEPSTSIFQDNNIALLQMNDPVSFTPYVKPICLWSEPMDQSQIVRQSATLNGLKIQFKSLILPTTVEVGINSLVKCQSVDYSVNTTSRSLCTPRLGHFGDDLPFLMFKRNGRWLLRGVNSMKRYIKIETHWVYADMAEYISWIRKNIL